MWHLLPYVFSVELLNIALRLCLCELLWIIWMPLNYCVREVLYGNGCYFLQWHSKTNLALHNVTSLQSSSSLHVAILRRQFQMILQQRHFVCIVFLKNLKIFDIFFRNYLYLKCYAEFFSNGVRRKLGSQYTHKRKPVKTGKNLAKTGCINSIVFFHIVKLS